MPLRPVAASLLALALLLPAAQAAEDDALKALDGPQKKVVAAFLKHQGGDGDAPGADQALVTGQRFSVAGNLKPMR